MADKKWVDMSWEEKTQLRTRVCEECNKDYHVEGDSNWHNWFYCAGCCSTVAARNAEAAKIEDAEDEPEMNQDETQEYNGV